MSTESSSEPLGQPAYIVLSDRRGWRSEPGRRRRRAVHYWTAQVRDGNGRLFDERDFITAEHTGRDQRLEEWIKSWGPLPVALTALCMPGEHRCGRSVYSGAHCGCPCHDGPCGCRYCSVPWWGPREEDCQTCDGDGRYWHDGTPAPCPDCSAGRPTPLYAYEPADVAETMRRERREEEQS